MSEYVYVITNPAFEGWCKVGLTTKTPVKRLAQYQTSDPHRAYHLEYAQPIACSKTLEREIHLNLRDEGAECQNEWFRLPVARAISMVQTAVSDLD